jgi:hypothetical protein
VREATPDDYLLSTTERGGDMRGVKYLYSANGKRTGVLIDLERNRALWEDLFDIALARTRAGEPTVAWTAVRHRLERGGRLKPVTSDTRSAKTGR